MGIPHLNPYREVDWRSRRCEALIEQNKRPSRRLDDHLTWAGWRFFRALDQVDDEQRRERVRRRRPDLAAAKQLQESGDAFRRWEVESRLLAGESFATVAVKCGLSPEAVEAYAHFFFDVTGALDATYWIVLRVIRYTPSRTITEDDAETFLKLYAYFSGGLVLDALLEYFRNPEPIPDSLDTIDPTRLPRVAQHVSIRAAIAARCAPAGDPRPVELLRLAESLQALLRNVGDVPVQTLVNLPDASVEQDPSPMMIERAMLRRRAS